MFTLRDVYRARQRISKYIRPTPLVYSKRISKELDADVYFKLENTNPTNSFKVRGGVYFISVMRDRLRGVVTASMGNHAQSMAYAGSVFGVDVAVVMPSWVSHIKKEAVEEMGAKVITYGSYYDEAATYARHYAEENGLSYVDAINEEKLYPGVATMHLEVVEELPDLEVFINPLGGGSGAIGAVTVYKTVNRAVRVYAVQAEGAPAFYLSMKKGELSSTDGVKTAAEGLAVAKAYETPFNCLRNRIDDVLLVSDEEMEKAVVRIFQSVRQVAELAGAASTAAAYRYAHLVKGRKVVLNVTGGNIDHTKFAEILSKH
ncbi:MAG: pyridoxal-phosphate dependent enzyme [Candidatus Caldarchaeum sp.]|nr:pyridoxal-phosphate dependent enzyme [Candidatus Caldarchaeum sp.]